jgi:arylsulfatase A-like enzyme
MSTRSTLAQQPNVIIIYADDLGYGDVSCYGAVKLKTPNIDLLASRGIRFTNGHAAAATCTPSRYALMTGQYAFRKSGTGVLPGDAALVVPTNYVTLPSLFQQAGYKTGIVGKWHLGLGTEVKKDWNGTITPGPNETGFDYSFIFPATADRVPTVFIENHRVIGLDSSDVIQVDYVTRIGNEPTGKENPELLKMRSAPNHGHDQTIVNGIGRIGFMTGGKRARWVDEEVPLTFLAKAKQFIDEHKARPFFLYYSLTEPHVPRMPSTMFKNVSGLGARGDAILQLDWAVGEIMKALATNGLSNNTLVIFTSDNGPVLDDGYEDEAVTRLNGHTPAGPFRGGKYSIFEAGTRVPFIVSWPGKINPATSSALISQMDFIASFAEMLKRPLPNDGFIRDSENVLPALLGEGGGRKFLVEQASTLAIIQGNWKYIRPSSNTSYMPLTNTETGNSPEPQLYDLSSDPGEKSNVAKKESKKVDEMEERLKKIVGH